MFLPADICVRLLAILSIIKFFPAFYNTNRPNLHSRFYSLISPSLPLPFKYFLYTQKKTTLVTEAANISATGSA